MEQILNDFIERRRAEIVAFTQELIGYQSVYAEDAGGRANAPFGNGIADALEAVLAKAASLGFSTRNLAGFAGTVDMGAGGALMGAMAHVDVVPAGAGWRCPPFSGTLDAGRLYGRGSLDDKGPLAATLYAMLAVARSGLPIRNRFRLIAGTDEETACRGLAYYLTKEPPLQAGFSPDGEFPVIHGEKGGLQLSCEAAWDPGEPTAAAFRIRSLRAGVRINVVPEEAEACLEADEALWALAQARLKEQPERERYTLRRAGGTVTVLARGDGAHAATPWQGHNAIGALLRFLRRLPLAPQAAGDYLYALADLFGCGDDGAGVGLDWRDAISTPLTLCLTMLDAGPQGGCARFDLRYPLLKTKEEVLGRLQAAGRARKLEIRLDRFFRPLYLPLETPLVQTLLSAYRGVTGRMEAPVTIGGGTYCREMPNTLAFGPVFPGEKELAHEKDEYITVENLITCAKIYAQAIYALVR